MPVNLAMNLTDQDIQEIMLIENVQREDLTPLEEAKGIQMCLDLGIDESRLSEKTGMSKATIKRRKVLLNYDNDVVKKSFASGATMQDYIDLEQVSDPKTREKLASKYLGTSDFKYQLKKAIDDEKLKKWQEDIVARISGWASPVGKENKAELRTLGYIVNNSEPEKEELEKPAGCDDGDLFFYELETWSIYIYVKYADPSKHKSPAYVKSKEEIERDKKKANLERALDTAKEVRMKYMIRMKNYLVKDQHKFKMEAFAVAMKYVCLFNSEIRRDDFFKITGRKAEKVFADDVGEYFANLYDRKPLYASLLGEYLILEGSIRTMYDYYGRYNKENASMLRELYTFLEGIDYVPSNTEKMLIDGTHPDYVKDHDKEEPEYDDE